MSDEEQEQKAARILQKHWRQRRAQGADVRWQDAMTQAHAMINLQSAERGENDPKNRMKRAVFLAGRLRDGEALLSDEENLPEASTENSKILETQHWLELTDGKHRYGSNLKFYHRKWQEEDTEENFFMWLDRGGGKDLSLPECSREQLEKERIIYLSKEQRANYLVKIDEKVGGCSAGLGITSMSIQKATDGKTQASVSALSIPLPVIGVHIGNGQGIVPMTPEEMRGAELSETPSKHGKIGFITSPSNSELNTGEEHYTETAAKPGDGKMMRAFRNRFTSQGVMERLLRKTVKKNTWIYVCDMKRNFFVGIKDTGSFQHSSFTAGGLVSSAGLITVKSGRIHKLSPLSGHYRTSVQHFRLFLDDLAKQGADLSKVQATKEEMTLWGLEHYKRFQKAKQARQKTLTNTIKSAVSPKPKPERTQSNGGETRTSSDLGQYEEKLNRQKEKDAEWANDSQWRRDILYGRKVAGAQPMSRGNDIQAEQAGGIEEQGNQGN